MRNNVLNIRTIYNVNGQVFNVGSDGTMKRFDPIFRQSYGYASADNIKHCVVEKFSELTNTMRPQRYYAKNIKDGEKDKQGEVYTSFDLRNPYIRMFGVWNPNEKDFKKEKYNKCALTSIVRFSDMLPLHTLLTNFNQTCGVNHGNANDTVYFVNGDNSFLTIEDLVTKGGKSKEDAEKMFRTTRAANFYNKNATSSGIYYTDFHIDLNNIKYVNITDVTLSDNEKESYIKDGYEIVEKYGKVFFVVPTEQAIADFCYLVESLFQWDFMSNNSVHGSVKEKLRTTISLNNTHIWQEANMAYCNEDGKTATMEFSTKNEDETNNIFSFNSKLLKKFHNNPNLEYIANADKSAIEKIREIGIEMLSNIEF